MTIAREQLKGMDFRDVATGRRLAPVHPGEVLMKDFIEPLGITRYKVAKLAGVQQRRIDEIFAGNRSITGDTALRLARLFTTDAAFWINLQAQCDLETTYRDMHERIEEEVTAAGDGSVNARATRQRALRQAQGEPSSRLQSTQ